MTPPWRVIGHRTVGAPAWDAVPSADIAPDVAHTLEVAGHVVLRVRTIGRTETLEIREVGA